METLIIFGIYSVPYPNICRRLKDRQDTNLTPLWAIYAILTFLSKIVYRGRQLQDMRIWAEEKRARARQLSRTAADMEKRTAAPPKESIS